MANLTPKDKYSKASIKLKDSHLPKKRVLFTSMKGL